MKAKSLVIVALVALSAAFFAPPARADVSTIGFGITNSLAGNVTNTTVPTIGTAVKVDNQDNVGILFKFQGSGVGTTNVLIQISRSIDGISYETTPKLNVNVLPNGTTAVVYYTNFTRDVLGAAGWLKVTSIGTDNALASTVRRLFDEAAPAAAYALAKNMVDYVYGLILAASFTNSNQQALANFGRPDVIDMGVQLNLRGVPMGAMNRTLLLHSTYFGTLAKDSAIVTLASFQKSEIITDGSLPNVHGFTVVDAPNLPSTGNMVGFGFSKSALVLATRLPNDYSAVLPGASYGNVTTVTDPDLGISVMQVQYVNHDLGTATQRIALMYGAAVGQANAGQLLVSA